MVDGGRRHLCGRPAPGEAVPEAVVVSNEVWRAVAAGGSAGLGRAWSSGWWSCASLDDLTLFLRVVVRNLDSLEHAGGIRGRIAGGRRHPQARDGAGGPEEGSDGTLPERLGGGFFALLLDETGSTSAGIFSGPSATLHDAQVAKLEHVCRVLSLSPAHHVLETGTRWGSFAVHAASHHGCRVTATTTSPEEHEAVTERVRAAGLADLVTVLLGDHRDLAGTYDRVVSLGGLESLDSREHGRFLAACGSRLAPGGLMALETAVVADQSYERARRTEDFVSRYVSPGSALPSVASIAGSVARDTDMRIVLLEDVGNHLAETHRRWRESLVAHAPELDALGVDEVSRKMFEFSLCYREAALAERRISDVECVLAKPAWRAPGTSRLAL